MDRVLMFDHNMKEIGLYTRTVTRGPEWDLVEDFIEYYFYNFLKNNKTNHLAVFVEPKIASGFPDIVFASYSTRISANWSDQREKLHTNDLKIMSHLLSTKGSTGSELINRLKMPEKDTLQAIEKLLDARMIVREQGLWKPADVKNGDFAAFGILDKTHRDTRNRTLDGNAGVHKSKRGAADGSLRSRSVGRKNFGYESDCVREFVLGRNHRLKSPFCQSAVTDFTSAGAS